jgi:adenylosuccinate synthase
MKTFAIIGAGYGDEGKGLITDYLSRRFNSRIVGRFNGGAQAGHTVVQGDKRKVFHQISSGTFNGANTYLGSKFIVNPYLLGAELLELKELGYTPKVFCSSDAKITTIYDMALNITAELSRTNKHGSCGLGINETITRIEKFPKTSFNSIGGIFAPKNTLITDLEYIHKEWIPQRLIELGIKNIPTIAHEKSNYVLLNVNYNRHVDEILKVLEHVEIINHEYFSIKEKYNENLILEGAQGLALDEHLGVYPNVTRSTTGLPNAIESALELGYNEIKPIYVTRCYTTRHGAGTLKGENEFITNKDLFDETNVENEWQDIIRYAPLNLKLIKRLIECDLTRSNTNSMNILSPLLAITCVDQIGESLTLYDIEDNLRVFTNKANAFKFIQEQLEIQINFFGFGPNKVYDLGMCT